GLARDRLAAETVCVGGSPSRSLRDPVHVVPQRSRNARRRFPNVDLPCQVHRVVKVNLNPCELVVLLLKKWKTQVVGGDEQSPCSVGVEALMGIPAFGSTGESMRRALDLREIRQDPRLNLNRTSLERQGLRGEALRGRVVAQVRIPRFHGIAV